ncbi:ImmA/IrrE family metallo-endopeptidase [Lentzea sp. BCCO 10_0798]|uniref:ImmA/IrrE family metallo-endopeptidase n=1 Tax=Lentzea kristufekii TaxID=3095430 RepID=A0ABU4TK31_9PSEU|nr:ImmA/IrrE family metallo-endopeptidase [Lentzea sp. BCCO 10_0798]MDX8048608.1 ImmA/IrrE family metallo-endopeptidase [Lentzea sp. BCCO 10_0798]
MDLARVRKRCEEEIRRLRIGTPLDVTALCERLAEQRGRPLHLLALTSRTSNPSGLWVAAKKADYIFYDESVGEAHRAHIVLHEIGHMVFEHAGVAELDDLTARLLAPNLDPKVVRQLLCRDSYDNEHEQEAELFATLVLMRAGFEVVGTVEPDVEEDAALARLREVLSA